MLIRGSNVPATQVLQQRMGTYPYPVQENIINLSKFTLRETLAILQDWENFAATIYPASAEADSAELRDHAEAMLKTIAIDIDTPQDQF